MDLVNQDKFKNWLLIILVAMNILTVSIIWMQSFSGGRSAGGTGAEKQSDSKDIVSKALKFDESQAGRFEKIRSEQRDMAKRLNDSLDTLKKNLADELFKPNPDTSYAYRISIEIGYLQSRLEMNRFKHFADLMSISTPDQKEKLKPVILDIFTKKPAPKPAPQEQKKPSAKTAQPVTGRDENERMKPEPPQRNEQKGPSIDDKIEKYSSRLKLTGEQVMKLRALLENTRNQAEKANRKRNMDAAKAADMKTKNRELEDEAVMNILDENQKNEFKKMLEKRGK